MSLVNPSTGSNKCRNNDENKLNIINLLVRILFLGCTKKTKKIINKRWVNGYSDPI